MPYEVATGSIEEAVRAVLVAYAPLTALIASRPSGRGGGPAIYEDGNVPQGAPMPYLTIGAWTQIGFHTLGASDTDPRWGWNCTGMIKAVGQRALVAVPGQEPEAAIRAVMSQVFTPLPQGKRLAVTGYGSAWCDEFHLLPALKTAVNNVVTVEIPAVLRVFVHDD